jgi:hypothetical protein
VKSKILGSGRERPYSTLLALTKTGMWPHNPDAGLSKLFIFIHTLEPSLPWKFGVKQEEVT